MAMLTLKGKITNYVEFEHGGGYATINSLMVECEDGRRQTFEKALIGRSDVMQTLEAAMQAGEPVELHIERPLAAHLFGGAQIFGIKTTRIAHFDPRNVALEQARLIPLVLLAAMVVGGIFGLFSGHGLFVGVGGALALSMVLFVLCPPLWVWGPAALIGTIGILLTRGDRRKAFYGDDPAEARRIKSLEPVSI
jgi:hypothetical protein